MVTTAPKLTIVSSDTRPVSVAEARDYCRLFDDSHDATLAILIDAAIEFLEKELREVLHPRRFRWTGLASQWTAFPKWPVQTLHSLSIDNAAQTIGNYTVDDTVQPNTLEGTLSGALVIEWTAGFAVIPAARKLLTLAIVAEFQKNREAQTNPAALSTSVKLLLQSQKSEYDAVR